MQLTPSKMLRLEIHWVLSRYIIVCFLPKGALARCCAGRWLLNYSCVGDPWNPLPHYNYFQWKQKHWRWHSCASSTHLCRMGKPSPGLAFFQILVPVHESAKPRFCAFLIVNAFWLNSLMTLGGGGGEKRPGPLSPSHACPAWSSVSSVIAAMVFFGSPYNLLTCLHGSSICPSSGCTG